jgi:predicted RNA-binding Zn ribbon-like protein
VTSDRGATLEQQRFAEALGEGAAATGTLAPLITLRPGDLPSVRELRERLRSDLRAHAANASAHLAQAASGPAVGGPAGELKLSAAPDGRMRYRPAAEDGRAIAQLVAAGTLLGQARGTWPHLKTCANPACGICFYDTSPNRSRVWHDTRTCGNTSNRLRPRCVSP